MLPGKISINIHPIVKGGALHEQKDLISFLKKEKDIHERFDEGNNHVDLDESTFDCIRLLVGNKDIKEEEIIHAATILSSDFSIDPLDEILWIVDRCKYQVCASDLFFIISVVIDIEGMEIPLAYISLLVDERITLFGKKAGFFIGIRKSFSFAVAQALGASKEYPKMSGLLIEAVEIIARFYEAKAIFTFPLARMYHILCSHYGFSTLAIEDGEERLEAAEEAIKVGYCAPCLTLVDMDGAEDVVYRLFE